MQAARTAAARPVLAGGRVPRPRLAVPAAAGRRDLRRSAPLLPVPHTQPWFAGVANLRGGLHGVVDLARFLGLRDAARPKRGREQARLVALQPGAGHELRAAGRPPGRPAQRRPTDAEADDGDARGRRLPARAGATPTAARWQELDLAELAQRRAFPDDRRLSAARALRHVCADASTRGLDHELPGQDQGPGPRRRRRPPTATSASIVRRGGPGACRRRGRVPMPRRRHAQPRSTWTCRRMPQPSTPADSSIISEARRRKWRRVQRDPPAGRRRRRRRPAAACR